MKTSDTAGTLLLEDRDSLRLRAFDLNVRWSYAIGERLTLQTNVGFYNLFNFANFNLPSAALNGLLTGAAGQINGDDTPEPQHRSSWCRNGGLLARRASADRVRAAHQLLVLDPLNHYPAKEVLLEALRIFLQGYK